MVHMYLSCNCSGSGWTLGQHYHLRPRRLWCHALQTRMWNSASLAYEGQYFLKSDFCSTHSGNTSHLAHGPQWYRYRRWSFDMQRLAQAFKCKQCYQSVLFDGPLFMIFQYYFRQGIGEWLATNLYQNKWWPNLAMYIQSICPEKNHWKSAACWDIFIYIKSCGMSYIEICLTFGSTITAVGQGMTYGSARLPIHIVE